MVSTNGQNNNNNTNGIIMQATMLKSVLSDGKSNAKQAKNEGKGYLSYNLSLAPHKLSGHSMCARAEIAGCDKTCLGDKTGRNEFDINKQAKINRTLFYKDSPEQFITTLHDDIYRAERKAKKNDLKLLVRLNNYSDNPWELLYPDLFDLHPYTQYMDYTKLPYRKDLPDNYDLTYSLSAKIESKHDFAKCMDHYLRCSLVVSKMLFDIVFKDMSETDSISTRIDGQTFFLLNGDIHDMTFTRPKNTILVLREKTSKFGNDINPIVYRSFESIGL
jgi:hypothetical protein